MSKYFKTFEELKLEFIGSNGEIVDLINDDKDAQEDYSRRSRFGRNPEANAMDYERRNWIGTYDDYLSIVVCSKSRH